MEFWKISHKLMVRSGVAVPINFVKRKMLSNLNYPGLASFTELLDDLQIEYSVFRANTDNIQKIRYPFLAFYKPNPNKSVTIVKSNKNLTANFMESWNGIVFYIPCQQQNSIKNSAFLNQHSKYRLLYKKKAALIISLLTLLSLRFILFYDIYSLFLSFTALFGIYLSSQLLLIEFGKSNAVADKFCSTLGKKFNCRKVSSSIKFSQSGNWGFSDAALMFFTFLFTFIYIPTNEYLTSQKLILLYPPLAISLIFIPLSFLQQIKIKQWCSFCLAICFLLIVNFVIVSNGSRFKSYNFNSGILFLGTLALVASLIWFYIKPLILNAIKNEEDATFLTKCLNIRDVFLALLYREKKVSSELITNDLTFGNPKAQLKITLVVSPFCSKCIDAYLWVNDIITNFTEDVFVILRFFATTDREDDHQNLVTDSILQALNSSQENAKDALKIWFETQDLDNFRQTFSLNMQTLSNIDLLISYKNWCLKNHIISTPAIFIDEHAIPRKYNIDQLYKIIPQLIIRNNDVINA